MLQAVLGRPHGFAIDPVGVANPLVVIEADRLLAVEQLVAIQLMAAAIHLLLGATHQGLELLDAVAQVAAIHLGDRLARHHRVALLHEQFHQQALAFGADVDAAEGLELAAGRDHPRQAAQPRRHRVGG